MKELSSKETINGEFAPGDKKKDLVTFGSGTHQPQSAQSLLSSKSSYDSIGSITYGSQGLLPRLPIPTLEETLEKFPKVLEALQDEQEREETKRVVEEFLAGPGPVLQQALMDYEAAAVEAGGIGSYVEEFWNESYLAGDSSVVLNLNPFFVLEEGPDPKIAKDQLHRAASLCFAALKLASQLKDETIPPDTFKGKPLCMDQFKVLFGSSRQPAAHETDDVHVYPDSSHVAVLCKNQFYYFQALWPVSYEVAVDEYDILDILRAIQKHADGLDPVEASRNALGVLTSLPRTEWAVTRNEICQTQVNATNLDVIDSALFLLVLDDYEEPDIHDAAANMLHGTSVLANDDQGNIYQAGTCLNRWYDKLQIIVCCKGTAGINFEHSAVDGHTALRFVSDVFAETVITFAESIVDLIHGRNRIQHVVEAEVNRAAVNKDANGFPLLDVFPKKLVFELPDSIKERIYYAETSLCDDLSSNDTIVLEFRDYGKSLIVGNKMSPDSYVQMSIILAYYKLYGKVVSTYEPVLTKSFYHGRTEAMRSATTQAKDLCTIWCNKSAKPEAKMEALLKATKEHSRLVRESAGGKGIDRHLFALKCLSQRQNMPLPSFFQSKAWATLNHTILSTSNCGNPALRLFGFGPVVSDGFGIGYIIKDNGLQYSVSSKHRQNERYVQTLRSTLKEMQELLKPISSVEVGALHRPSLKEVKAAPSRQSSSYGDIWGETEMVLELQQRASLEPEPTHKTKARRASRFFSQVIPQRVSLPGRGSAGAIDVDLDGEEVKEE